MQILSKKHNEDGQGLVEYALILVLVAIVVILILQLLGASVTLGYARVIGGLRGETLNETGPDALLLSYETSNESGPPTCRADVTDIKFVATNDGNLVTDTSVSVKLRAAGGNSPTISGTAGGNGLVTVSGPVTMVGNCPLSLTVTR